MFQAKHKALLPQYESHKTQTKGGAKRKRDDDSDVPEQVGSPYVHHENKTQVRFVSSQITQAAVDQLIMNHIIGSMRPMSTVEDKTFIALIEGLQPSKKVMTRKTLSVRIDNAYSSMVEGVTGSLASVSWVCTTADIWSVNNRSFFGVTAHWLSDDLQRRSYALACRRFKGSHTHSRIAEILSDIHSEYKLDVGKIVCTVTDNAANFKKAFTEYMAPDPDGDEESGDEDDINVADVNIILQEGNQALADDLDENEDYIHLPTHHKCVSHTLNLIATTDADKALSSPAYSRIYHGSMGNVKLCGIQSTAAAKLLML